MRKPRHHSRQTRFPMSRFTNLMHRLPGHPAVLLAAFLFGTGCATYQQARIEELPAQQRVRLRLAPEELARHIAFAAAIRGYHTAGSSNQYGPATSCLRVTYTNRDSQVRVPLEVDLWRWNGRTPKPRAQHPSVGGAGRGHGRARLPRVRRTRELRARSRRRSDRPVGARNENRHSHRSLAPSGSHRNRPQLAQNTTVQKVVSATHDCVTVFFPS